MSVTLTQLQKWLIDDENERLEFKKAENNYPKDKLVNYCVALANERGGRFILGVTDHKPRQISGTQAFLNLAHVKHELLNRLRLRIEADEIVHPNGRVIVFTVPSRPLGIPILNDGIYWMRSGESLVPMSQDQLKRIFDESVPDFSAQICPNAVLADLDERAINEFRARWIRKSGNQTLINLSVERLLIDAELITENGITYAALILFGTRQVLGRYLAQAEVVFEYRSNESPGPANQREEFRQGYFLHVDALWNLINLRNDKQFFRDSFFAYDIPTFNETACREAILNAVSHRDYQNPSSVFIRQFPRRLEVVSPGGFPPGITPENMIDSQLPRNRRLAEAFARCGLVERAGQGADLIFGLSVAESKPQPDFTKTDEYKVSLTLNGEVQDPDFLLFLEKIGRERTSVFTTQDWLILDLVNREQKIPNSLKIRLPFLLEQGVIERAGGRRFLLARQFYDFVDKKGVYTRKHGLDRETNKTLLMKHIKDNNEDGSRLQDLCEVLPAFSRRQVQVLLQELREENRVKLIGKTSNALWYMSDDNQEIVTL
ncbi:MAG: ATP-binding protein [Pyrinomonadaceae bacterium]